MSQPLRVVVTGAESTGKTTLARGLSKALSVPYVPESSRRWVERFRRVPAYRDVTHIAEQHEMNAASVLRAHHPVHLMDTDLFSTLVYSLFYFKKVPAEVVRRARAARADLYLLNEPDFPWEPDPGQRDSPAVQAELARRFESELKLFGATVVTLWGSADRRLEAALSEIQRRRVGVA